MEERSDENLNEQNELTETNREGSSEASLKASTEPSGEKTSEAASFEVVSENEYEEAARIASMSEENAAPKKERKKRSVPLVAFVASLLAVVLVCGMFTVAIGSSMRYYGYLEGLGEIVSSGGAGDDQQGSGGLFDELFGSDDFKGLEFIDWLFENYSYYDLQDVDFLTAVLKAYVEASGDIYAEYYTQEEFDALFAENAGEGVGIGVSVLKSKVEVSGVSYTALEIITTFPNSPAMEAGVCPGDYVVYVGCGEDRELVDTIGYDDALMRLRGEKGTLAEFVVLRPTSQGTYEEVEFSITRDEYTMPSVEYKISETDSSVGIVRILQFDLTTPTQFRLAMDDLIGNGIQKFVFDVRNNPGGDLRSINAVLSLFLEEGDVILSAVDRSGKKEEYFAVPTEYTAEAAGCTVLKSEIGKYRGYEMTVLTNGNTASAAELFTAAMRDYELATVIGEKTYGKGSMQSTFDLGRFGLEGGVKLTTRHYFPPCGEGYHGIGIAPHIEVSLSEEAANTNIYKLAEADDAQLLAALDVLSKK